jgi:hypothetical protein
MNDKNPFIISSSTGKKKISNEQQLRKEDGKQIEFFFLQKTTEFFYLNMKKLKTKKISSLFREDLRNSFQFSGSYFYLKITQKTLFLVPHVW